MRWKYTIVSIAWALIYIQLTSLSSISFGMNSNLSKAHQSDSVSSKRPRSIWIPKPDPLYKLGISYRVSQVYWNESEKGACFDDPKTPATIKNFTINTNGTALGFNMSSAEEFQACGRSYVTVHGFRGSQNDSYMHYLNDHLIEFHEEETLEGGRCNTITCIIMLDWERGASGDWDPLYYYTQAAVNTQPVGEDLARLLFFLRTIGHIRFRDTHVIGFSLGAQVSHFAANAINIRIKQSTEKIFKLKRITGLDPAACHFSGTWACLNSTDAAFVDVVHTTLNSRPCQLLQLLEMKFGVAGAIGHMDFYLNGGEGNGKYCSGVACAHSLSVYTFADSLDRSLSAEFFLSIPCYDLHDASCRKSCTERMIGPLGSMMGMHSMAVRDLLNGSFYTCFPGKEWLISYGRCNFEKGRKLRPEDCKNWPHWHEEKARK